MNNCENPSSKPRTVHLRFVTEEKKKRKRSRFVILRAEDARGSVIFKRRYIFLNIAVERCVVQIGLASIAKKKVSVDSTHATAESPENQAAIRSCFVAS